MTRNILFSFISIFSLNAQDIEPVEWQYDVNKINDTEYNISFSASILEGWKLYSQFSPNEGASCTFCILSIISPEVGFKAFIILLKKPGFSVVVSVTKSPSAYFTLPPSAKPEAIPVP